MRYLGEVICSGYEWRTAKDTVGEDRQAIVFQLVRASGVLEQEPEVSPPGASLAELAAAADADPTEESTAPRTVFARRTRAVRRSSCSCGLAPTESARAAARTLRF